MLVIVPHRLSFQRMVRVLRFEEKNKNENLRSRWINMSKNSHYQNSKVIGVYILFLILVNVELYILIWGVYGVMVIIVGSGFG